MSHFLGGLPCDIAIVTVLPVEFDAIRRVFEIDVRDRSDYGGSFFYRATVYSGLLERPLKVVITCIGEASHANAGIMTTKIITVFDPSLIVLVGIAGGMRDGIKIGDVIVPREIADFSLRVAKAEGAQFRPHITPRPFAVQQMIPGFVFDEAEFHRRCREAFGPPIIPAPEQEAEFAKHVTFKPNVLDKGLGTSDTLVKDPAFFQEMVKVLDTIRATDMESGGVVKACESQARRRDWLVVRGISDFGDELKNDDFHKLASCSAAVWLKLFLEFGFYTKSTNDGGLSPTAGSSLGSIPTSNLAIPEGIVKSSAYQFLMGPMERLARTLSEDRKRDLEELRDVWRTGHQPTVLSQLGAMKEREDWLLVEPAIRGKILRFEASLVLLLNKDVPRAKQLTAEAATLDGETSPEALSALIAFHEFGAERALQLLAEPRTVDGWNVKLSLLISSNNYDAVLREWEARPDGVVADAESSRLRALGYLFLNDVSSARIAISSALSERPLWFGLRLTAAVIDYFACLSPPLLRDTDKNWPVPTDPMYVRRDEMAITGLRRAAETFKQLLSQSSLDSHTKKELEGWRLACLANDFERQTEAQSYCGLLIDDDPTHFVAVAWASARGYVLNLDRSVAELSAVLFPDT